MNKFADQNIPATIIVGAGPAGLTAAYELADGFKSDIYVFESDSCVGGISKTVNYKGNRIDIGGHRFFSKSKIVTDWWNRILPQQGEPSVFDKSDSMPGYAPGGPDPDKTDQVMLVRSRISRIFYLKKFFDYPISLSIPTLRNLGLYNLLVAGAGFVKASCFKRKEKSLEDFYINRFGKPLYEMFFEDYTTKVWGVHPSKLGADWGSQRVKGLSVSAIIKDILRKKTSNKSGEVETSLIEEFLYPKYGPGQLWETVAERSVEKGVKISFNSKVDAVNIKNGRVESVQVTDNGTSTSYCCDYLLSSMPLKDLVLAIRGLDVPSDVVRIAKTLPYRDFITVGLLVRDLKIKDTVTDSRIKDNWIYIQEKSVKLGRLQVFNNWSPFMVKDYENTVWLGLEYFCNEGDELWMKSESTMCDFAVSELETIGIIDSTQVIDRVSIKVCKAYPAYYGSYYELDAVKNFLNKIENLYCIGRNGQHRYNNMDHSMLSAMEAVKNIKNGMTDKTPVWNVNTEKQYHESK